MDRVEMQMVYMMMEGQGRAGEGRWSDEINKEKTRTHLGFRQIRKTHTHYKEIYPRQLIQTMFPSLNEHLCPHYDHHTTSIRGFIHNSGQGSPVIFGEVLSGN